MKKLLLSILSATLITFSFAQKPDLRKPTTIGISFIATDFATGAEIKKGGFGSVLRNGTLLKWSRINPGLALNYFKGLTNHIDIAASLGGTFPQYQTPNGPTVSERHFLLEATVNLNLKLLPDNYWVVPYLDLGVGANKYTSYYSAFVPFGMGLQINFFDQAFIYWNSQIRAPVTDNGASHLYHSITIAAPIGKKK